MEYCKQCVLYNEIYSQRLADWQDALPIGETPKEHFCLMYQQGIPDAIWNGKKTCEHRVNLKNMK